MMALCLFEVAIQLNAVIILIVALKKLAKSRVKNLKNIG